ncbi:hypothetical protein CA606_14775 [Caulobacter vibrioides]|uniref:DUF4440 domain-containing protein n=1 Tax=Caulobacter vibrioides TaxID=155892 RepID=A0A290MYL4_CAUVI|nr:hypothetical protein [Caulobacter vibrioides]ATC33490.1 hypothetical protein CA606_14775 [Caulobacter vibrioides]
MPLIAIGLAAALTITAVPADAEDKAVLATTQAFFDGLEAADPVAMRAAALPNIPLMALSTKPDGTVDVRRFGFEDSFGKKVAPGLKEWMWSPVVVRRGALATVTGPFEITREGKTVHCGVNVFTLAKTEGAWKVASVSWTAEPDACPELRKR